MVSSNGGSPPATGTRNATKQRNAGHLQGALKLLLWSLFSSGTIFLNKRLYTSGGFLYPLASTAVGQFTTAMGGCMLVVFGVFPRNPPPHPSQAFYKLVPAALATSGTLFAGNYAYLTLSIAFMQMMKGFTPGLTLILAGLLGKERFAFRLAAAVLAVCAGTAAAALLERRAAAHFSAQGMFWMMFSSLSECLRVVMIQTVGEAHTVTPTSEPSAQHAGKPESSSRDVHCSQEPVVSSVGTQATQSPRLAIRKAGAEPMSLDLAETLMYVSGPASIILAVLSSIIERQGIVDALFGSSSFSEAHREGASGAAVAGAGSVVQTVLLLAAVAVASLLTNLAGYSAVQATSSLTFKVAGVAKNMAVITGGLLLGERVGGLQLCGYLVSSMGTRYYSAVRRRMNRERKELKGKLE